MPSYKAEDIKQALGRVHRAGGSRSIQKILYADRSIEKEICLAIRRKLNNLDALNDGEVSGVDLFMERKK